MNPNYLEFEQPIAKLETKIEELRLVGENTEINIADELAKLEDKSKTLTAVYIQRLVCLASTANSASPAASLYARLYRISI